MVPRTSIRIPRRGRPNYQIPQRDLQSSIPWHAAFAILIPVLVGILQMHCQGSSPLRTHPANMWTFMLCLLIYCFALGYPVKSRISSSASITYQKLSDKVALFSGSMASAALISVLVSRSFEPIVFIICLILLFIYFARNQIMRACENIVSYVKNMWKGITRSNDDPVIIMAP